MIVTCVCTEEIRRVSFCTQVLFQYNTFRHGMPVPTTAKPVAWYPGITSSGKYIFVVVIDFTSIGSMCYHTW